MKTKLTIALAACFILHLFAHHRACHACGGCGQVQAAFVAPQVVVPQFQVQTFAVAVPQVQFQTFAAPAVVGCNSCGVQAAAVRSPRVIRQRTVIRN